MIKRIIVILVYLVIINCCILYSGFSSQIIMTMLASIVFALSMYIHLIVAQFLKNVGLAKVIMNIIDGKLRYVVYSLFVGVLIVVVYMTVLFLNTKQFVYTVMYLPLIASYHSCKLFCKIIESVEENHS